jgi:hypothetical protein
MGDELGLPEAEHPEDYNDDDDRADQRDDAHGRQASVLGLNIKNRATVLRSSRGRSRFRRQTTRHQAPSTVPSRSHSDALWTHSFGLVSAVTCA